MDSPLLYLPHTSHIVYYLEAEGMNALNDTQCSLQIPFSLVCGLSWGRSLATTGSGQGSFFGNRRLSRRCLSPANSCSGPWSALLASSRNRYVSIVKGSMRSDSMFQCSLEGGLRFITILGPCCML